MLAIGLYRREKEKKEGLFLLVSGSEGEIKEKKPKKQESLLLGRRHTSSFLIFVEKEKERGTRDASFSRGGGKGEIGFPEWGFLDCRFRI